jgi:hypothetical protein
MNNQTPSVETTATTTNQQSEICSEQSEPQQNIGNPASTPPALRNPKTRRVRNGKIASLPVELRDSVGFSLYRGETHDEIAKDLNEDGYPKITRQNITNWARGGYQDWLKTHEFMADLSSKADLHRSFPGYTHRDALKLNDVNNFMLAGRMHQVIEHLDPKRLAKLIAANPELFFRFIKEEFNRQQQERELEYKIEDRKRSALDRHRMDLQMEYMLLPESERQAWKERKKAEMDEELKVAEQELRAINGDSSLAA